MPIERLYYITEWGVGQMKMTPEIISQYESLKSEIEVILDDIAEIEKQYGKVKASMDKHPYILLEIPVRSHASNETLALLRAQLQSLRKTRHEIELFLAAVPDSKIRQAIRLFYIKGYTWQQVANKIGGDSTADGLRMAVDRYFKKYFKRVRSVRSKRGKIVL